MMKRRGFVGMTSAGLVLTLAGIPVFAQHDKRHDKRSVLIGTAKI